MISTGVPSGRKGISSYWQIRAIPHLCCHVVPAILSPTEAFRFLSHPYPAPSSLTPAGSLVGFSRENTFTLITFAPLTMRYTKRGILYLTSLLTKYCTQQLLLGASSVSPFGLSFPPGYHPGSTSATNTDNTVFIQLTETFLTHVGDIPRNLLRSQLRLPGISLVLFNMD